MTSPLTVVVLVLTAFATTCSGGWFSSLGAPKTTAPTTTTTKAPTTTTTTTTTQPPPPLKPKGFEYLAVTLPADLNPLHLFTAPKYWFNKIPLTETAALKEKWNKLNGSDCRNNGRYAGVRYLPATEKSIAALYDSNGVIAGIQALYKVKSLVNGSNEGSCSTLGKGKNNYDFDDQDMINREVIDGIEYFVLTAYFTKPRNICRSCRNPDNIDKEGFGNALYFQNGPTPCEYFRAPKNRTVASTKGWTNNKCLPFNGHHNFYRSDLWDADSCSSFKPNWLFYDGKYELSGFGFSLPGCDGSWRYQHPPGTVVNYVVGSKCAKTIADTIKFSNINVYLKKPVETMLDCVDNTGFISTIMKFIKSYL